MIAEFIKPFVPSCTKLSVSQFPFPLHLLFLGDVAKIELRFYAVWMGEGTFCMGVADKF
jgi:hypothetical protein